MPSVPDYLCEKGGFYTGKGWQSITVENLGPISDYKDKYEDPVKHFKELYKKKSSVIRKELTNKDTVSLTIDLNDTLEPKTDLIRNIGYVVFKILYRKLKLDVFWKKHTAGRKFEYDVEKVFYLLVIGRLLDPGSKKYTYDNRYQFFEPIGDFELERKLSKFRDKYFLLILNQAAKAAVYAD